MCGRYDNLHGDEDELEADERAKRDEYYDEQADSFIEECYEHE